MIAAILLAAGESSRMGEPKQLLDWGGRPLVVAQIEALQGAGCRPVVVVLGAHADRVRSVLPARAEVQVTTNRNWRSGRASSIRAGARAVPPSTEAVVVVSVDQPTTSGVILQLGTALNADRELEIVVPRFAGRRGHPPMFRVDLLAELRAVSERGEGLRELRRRYVSLTAEVDVDEPLVGVNLNTLEAYQQAIDSL